MPWVADDLGAWLIAVLADAGRKKLTAFILGTDQERALREASAVAVRGVAQGVFPMNAAHADNLARVISHVFGEPTPPAPLDPATTLLSELCARIDSQLAVLDDAERTGTGRSSASYLGVSGADLAERLSARLTAEILRAGAAGGPLAPLADQLNHDITHLQGQQIGRELERLTTLLADGTTGGHRPAAITGRLSAAVSALPDTAADADQRLRYESQTDHGRLVIGPRDPYLDVLRSGGLLVAQSYKFSLWERRFAWPTLDVKIVNNADQTIFLDQAIFEVAMSRRDLRPVPVIRGCGRVTDHVFLPLGNSGWGPMDDCVFRFHLERDADPVPHTSEYSWSLDGNGQPLDDTPFIEALIEGGWPAPSAPVNRWDGEWRFTGQVVAAVGVLGYTQTELDGSRSRHGNPARVLFEIYRFQESLGSGFATCSRPANVDLPDEATARGPGLFRRPTDLAHAHARRG